MQERFSDRARHAMALANLEASRLSHNFLVPAHVLLGLIAEGECVATETLRVLHVNLDAVRDEVQSQMGKGDGRDGVGRRAHSEELRQVINHAIHEARKFGHRYVGTEHLILGLLTQAEGMPAKVLRKSGVDLGTVREKVLSVLRAHVEPDDDLAHSRHGEFEWVHQQELAKAFRSPKFWHTLILAVDSANRLGDGEIEPRHLLLALLRDTPNGIGKLLEKKGVTVDWVRTELTQQDAAR